MQILQADGEDRHRDVGKQQSSSHQFQPEPQPHTVTFPPQPHAQLPQATAPVSGQSQVGASPRPASSIASSRGGKDSTAHIKKPWGSSGVFKGASSGGSGGWNGDSGGRGGAADQLVLEQQRESSPRRGISQSSLRQRTGFSGSNFLDGFLGGKDESSQSEGASPRQPAPRSPSFMDSTKSSQAHRHAASSQGGNCDSDQHDMQRPAFRPSGVHVVVGDVIDAEGAAEDRPQHAQHAQHGEVVPKSAQFVHSSSFMDSTESSRAHHAEQARSQHAQHEEGKHSHSTADHTPASDPSQQGAPQMSAREHDAQVANPDDTVSSHDVQPEHDPDADDLVARTHLLHQSSGDEVAVRPLDQTASLSEPMQRGFDDSKRPSFMRPTASSIAHVTSSSPRFLNRSQSASCV